MHFSNRSLSMIREKQLLELDNEALPLSRRSDIIEVMENVRELVDNLVWDEKTGVESWVEPSHNESVKANLSRLIEHALEVVVAISKSDSGLMKKFAQEVLDSTKQDLQGLNFSGRILDQIDFICANLAGSNLSGANLTSADLTFADLRGADEL